VRGSCALAQDGMSLLGYVLDLHARHGAIMALEAPIRKHAVMVEGKACTWRAGNAREARFWYPRWTVPPSGESMLGVLPRSGTARKPEGIIARHTPVTEWAHAE